MPRRCDDGTERHGWLQGCAVHPNVQRIRCVENVASDAVAVVAVQWGMRATGQEVRGTLYAGGTGNVVGT